MNKYWFDRLFDRFMEITYAPVMFICVISLLGVFGLLVVVFALKITGHEMFLGIPL